MYMLSLPRDRSIRKLIPEVFILNAGCQDKEPESCYLDLSVFLKNHIQGPAC